MLPLTDHLQQQVIEIAQQAGELIKQFYAKSVKITLKEDNTPVTEADLASHQFIMQKLAELTPTIPILSEENCKIPLSERKQWQEYWLIDPLDGTQQFIDRTDQFGVIIALIQNNRPVLGVIHAPILQKTYYARLASGAFLQTICKTERLEPICKNLLENDRLQIAVGQSSSAKIAESVQQLTPSFMPYGSSSLKSGLVAEGIADCYVRFGNTGEWDTAAAEILLNEMGGQIFDLNFKPLTYNLRETLVNPHFVMVGSRQTDWQRIFKFK